MTRQVNVIISANASTFIASMTAAERAVINSVNAMKLSISSLGASFNGATVNAQNFVRITNNINVSSGASSSQINTLNSTLLTLVNRLSANTSAIYNSTTAMNTLTTATNSSTTAIIDMSSTVTRTTGSVAGLTAGFVALMGAQKVLGLFKDSKDAVVEAEASFTSFNGAVTASGYSLDSLNTIIEKYVKNTSLSRSEIQQSMSAMLKMKFTPDQMDKALGSATDLAAFGKQKGKSYGKAIVEGFEGLRMGISTNSDNMGWKENVAKAESTYAAEIGKTVEALTQEEKAQAYVQSMQRESIYVLGDAAKMQATLAGSIAETDKSMINSKETIGQALIPAFEALNTLVAGFYEFLALAINGFQITIVKTLGFIEKLGVALNALSTGNLKNVINDLDAIDRRVSDQIVQIKKMSSGYQGSFDSSGKKVEQVKEKNPKEKYEEERQVYDLMMAKALEEKKYKDNLYENDLAIFKQQLNNKLISLEQYKTEANKINAAALSDSNSYFDKMIGGLNKILSIGYAPKATATQIELEKAIGTKKVEEVKFERKAINIRGISGGGGRKISGGSGGGSKGDSAEQIAKAEFEYEKQLRDNDLNMLKSNNQMQIALSQYKFQNFKTSAIDYYEEVKKREIEEFNLNQKNLNANLVSLESERKYAKGKVDNLRINKELLNIKNQLSLSENQHTIKIREAEQAQEKYNQTISKTLALNNLSNSNKDSLKNIELGRIEKDKETLGGAIGGKRDTIGEQMQIDEAKYQLSIQYINAKKDYLMKNEKENYLELIALDQELTDLKRENIIQVAEAQKNQLIEQQQGYITLMNTWKSSGADFITDTVKNAGKLSGSFKSLGDSIEAELMKIASKNLMEKIFNIDAVDKFFKAFANNSTGSDVGSGIMSSLMGGGGGGGKGGSSFGSFFSSISSSFMNFLTPMSVGTNMVPKDMPALLHEGEAVIPKKYNNAETFGGGKRSISVTNNFISNTVPDKRTQHQMATSAGNSVKVAGARR